MKKLNQLLFLVQRYDERLNKENPFNEQGFFFSKTADLF